jgi:hypothetical protein
MEDIAFRRGRKFFLLVVVVALMEQAILVMVDALFFTTETYQYWLLIPII